MVNKTDQQNEQTPLTYITEHKQLKASIYDVGNPDPAFGQA